MIQPIEIFCCAAEADQSSLRKLSTQFAVQQQQGVIKLWDKSQIPVGAIADEEIQQHLTKAHIFLLLISSDFLADDYCSDIVMTVALERHECGEAITIPVIVRPSNWHKVPVLKDIQVLPRNGEPISSQDDQEHALWRVAKGIEAIIENLPPDPSRVSKKPKRQKPSMSAGTILMHVLKFMVTQRQGWTVIGVLVLLTGVLWGTSSPTTPYIPTPRGSDALIYSPMNNGDIYIYSKDMSGFYIARHSDFSPPIPIDRTKTYGNIQMEFLARSDMISVNDTTEGNVHVTQAHVIEWLKLYDGNTLLGTYTASDYNPSGYYESRWWPVAVALIAAGLLITSVALFVRRIRRKGASFVPST